MNVKRVTTALIGFPLVALVLILGNIYIVDIAFSAIAILSLYEYFHAFKSTGKANPIQWVGYILAAAISLIHVIPTEYTKNALQLLMPSIVVILFLMGIVTDMKINVKDISITLLGILYILGFIVFVPMLRGIENGVYLIWYLIFIAWGTDVFAYLIGKKFGKHKFSKISPNKSIEGCLAGIVGAVVMSLGYTLALNYFAGFSIPYAYIVFVSVALSILSQIGDFSASSIKRYVDLKDFSNLIPGHGGMLDRIDSLIFIAPFAYFLLNIL